MSLMNAASFLLAIFLIFCNIKKELYKLDSKIIHCHHISIQLSKSTSLKRIFAHDTVVTFLVFEASPFFFHDRLCYSPSVPMYTNIFRYRNNWERRKGNILPISLLQIGFEDKHLSIHMGYCLNEHLV